MKKNRMHVLMKLTILIQPMLVVMVCAIILGVLGFLCATFIPIIGAIGLFLVSEGIDLSGLVWILAIMGCARGFLRYGEQASNHYIAFKLLAHIRDKVFTSLRKLAPAKLDGKEKGELISIITQDIELLEVFYAHTISPVIIAVVMAVLMVAFFSTLHPYLALVALINYLIIGVALPLRISKISTTYGKSIRSEVGEISSFFLENIRGLRECIQFQREELQSDEINRRTESMSLKEKKLKKISGDTTCIVNAVVCFSGFLMFLIASYLMMNQGLSFSKVFVAVVAMLSSFGPFIALANLGTGLTQTLASGERVLDLLEEEPLVNEVRGEEDILFNGASLNDVTFKYAQTEVLDSYHLEIPVNKTVAIVGKSGSGKSTLLKLLMRFWDTTEGEVRLSNINVKDINTKSLRSNQGLVTQETVLFKDTIENNIKIANRNATNQQIVEACTKASIHDFIMSLPHQYQTQVGELGETLSGGERQRIGLARSFLHNAPFLLLDEPTSNLDSLNEAIILKSLQQEKHSKTIVLVSHRLSTTRIADCVVRINK